MIQRTAFVTGGVGTIGTEICRQFSHANYRVIASYHPLESDIIPEWQAQRTQENMNITLACCDLSNFDATLMQL